MKKNHEIKYVEPADYFPKEIRDKYFTEKYSIDDYKDRMSSPIGMVMIDMETREPVKKDKE